MKGSSAVSTRAAGRRIDPASPSSSTDTIKTEDARSAGLCSGYDITKMQCTKMLLAIDEATKNDATYIPSKLLDFIVNATLTDGSSWSMGGCTSRETCDWIVQTLKERVNLGQYWVALKVYATVHELLWRGSDAFVKSMEEHGMGMLQYNTVVEKIRATTQENVSGAALPCTINTSETVGVHNKASAEAKRPKPCLFTCNKSKSGTPKPQAATAAEPAALVCTRRGPVIPGQVNPCSPILLRTAPQAGGNTGFVDLCQEQQDFLWSLLAYLEAFCQYRQRHPNVDLVRGRLHTAPEAGQETTMAELKTLLDDTLEVLKCTAVSDPHVPAGCVLAMSIVRKRMNDARVMYNVACLTLLKMLEQLFLRAKLFMTAWGECSNGCSPVVSEKNGAAPDRQQREEANCGQSKSAASGVIPSASISFALNASGSFSGLTAEGLRDAMVELFAVWYHAIHQFDRTVDMLQTFCDEVERNTGETYLVASHLHRIPHKALDVIRGLLKAVKERGTCKPCRALSECDLASSIHPNKGEAHAPNSSASASGLLKNDSASSLENAEGDVMENATAHLKEIRNTWGLQLSALHQLFEMEGEVPPTLSLLQGELDDFINARKELMNSQSRQTSTLSNGLSASNFRNSNTSGSPLSLNTPMAALEPPGSHSGKSAPQHSASHNAGACTLSCSGVSHDDEVDSHNTKSLSHATTTDGSLADVRSMSTFIIRRQSGQQRVSKHPSSLATASLNTTTNARRSHEVDADMEVIPLTEEMRRTDESIQELLQADDVVVVCNEPFSNSGYMKLAERFQVISGLPPLGEGTFGRVFRGWDDLVGRYLAAKELPLDENKKRSSAVREVLKEYMVLTELDHPNIVRVVAFMVVGKLGRIFMEWMPSGSLQDVLHFAPHGVLRESVVSRYADDALHGLAYLHGRGVLHRDVKPGNMLLGSDGTVKLTDFGTSSVLAVGKHTLESSAIMGTAPYMAPEAVQGLYSTASDIWSFGCAVVELVTGRVPWTDPVTGNRMDVVPLLFKIGSLSDTDSATRDERPNAHIIAASEAESADESQGDVVVSNELADFLKKIFVVNRRHRATAEDLMNHPFITTHREMWAQRKRLLPE